MSSSLVRKGLDLFKDDLLDDIDTNKKKKKSSKPMKLVSTKKKGVQRQLKRLKHQQNNKNKTTLKDKKIKSALDEYKKQQTTDQTESNVQYLMALACSHKPDSKVVDSIVEQHRGKLAKNRKPEELVQEEASIFSDRDFDEFEKEYFDDD